MAILALTLVSILVLVAIFAPIVWGSEAVAFHPEAISQPASGSHWAGTDSAGRDIAIRVLVATRLSLVLALAATAIAVLLGVGIGSLPALGGARTGRFVSACTSASVAFPNVLLAIFVATIVGVGARGAVLALGIAGAPWFARLTLKLVDSVGQRDYVASARLLGVGRVRVLFRHILPNMGESLAVNATIAAGANLLAFAGLSYLGLGVQPPAYDWGRMLLEGVNAIYVNPAAAIAPGLAIVFAGLALNLTGELAAQIVGGRTRSTRRRPPARVPRPDAPAPTEGHLLEVRGLTVTLPDGDDWISPVRGVDLTIGPGASVGIVGESGSGKSLTALAVAQLLLEPAIVDADRLAFDRTDLMRASGSETRRALKGSLAFVFQDPMSSLNPLMRVGSQVAEVARVDDGARGRVAWERAVGQLRAVRIPAPERRAHQYPQEFSGGMRQRAMIGMGLMGRPRLVIADEPTTALDVTVQREVLRLLRDVQAETGAALLLISHDIAVVTQMCEDIVVMYAGRVVEEIRSDSVTRAAHPYTVGLVGALPTMSMSRGEPLRTIPGRPPGPGATGPGCPFAPRCDRASAVCTSELPALVESPAGRVACWHPVGSASTSAVREGEVAP